jgi:hypothetical protein
MNSVRTAELVPVGFWADDQDPTTLDLANDLRQRVLANDVRRTTCDAF